jgi:hypothetical protein
MTSYVAGLTSSSGTQGGALAWLFEAVGEANWDALAVGNGAKAARLSSTHGTALSLLLAGAKEARW